MNEEKPQSAVKWVKEHSKHKPNIRFVLYMLAQCIDEGNTCPSQKELAELTGLSKDTVRRALGELEKDGTIRRAKKGGKKAKGGNRDCIQLVATSYQHTATMPVATSTQQVAHSYQLPASSTQQPVKHETTPETPLSHTHAAGERESLNISTSSSIKTKDKKTLSPKGERQPPGKTLSRADYDALMAAVGEVFAAYGEEAHNYYQMLTGGAKKGDWAKCNLTPPVLAGELRSWHIWYRQKNQGVERVKKPEKVYSSIIEYRQFKAGQLAKPKPVQSTQDLEALRQAQSDGMYVPEGAKP